MSGTIRLIFYLFRVENGDILFGGRDSGVDGADEEEWVSDTEVRRVDLSCLEGIAKRVRMKNRRLTDVIVGLRG